MRATRGFCVGLVAVSFALFLAAGQARLSAQQITDPAIHIGDKDLGGIVTSVNGPEAGVWVIAETVDLPTKFAKIVVTDDRGRYLMPDLPNANYSVWVRGYGLVDSPKVRTAPGKIVNLSAVVAPNAAAAADYYPAVYWYSMLKIPDKSLFPGTGPTGNGMTETALAEIYEPPFPGYGPRGGDIDRNGVFWASLASGHLASFDRSKCKVLNGPDATGKHCPEGWTLYPFPGPQFKDVSDSGSVEASYYTWVDQFDTFGLGRNVPIATGNMNESLLALVDGKFVNLRVPYPGGYFTKWVDGRLDDPNAAWKGKALWTTYSTRTMFHLEGGKANRPRVVRFQLRPDPLAR